MSDMTGLGIALIAWAVWYGWRTRGWDGAQTPGWVALVFWAGIITLALSGVPMDGDNCFGRACMP